MCIYERQVSNMFNPIKEQKRLFEAWYDNMERVGDMFPRMDNWSKLFEVKIFDEPVELMETCVELYQNMMEPWFKVDENIMQGILRGDMDSYLDFFTEVSEKYEETAGKAVRMMNMGINLEAEDEQQKVVDAYYKMMFAAGKLAALIVKNNSECAGSMMENYQKMVKEGKNTSSLKEFYDLWYNTNEKSMEDFFATEAFSKAFADFTDKYFLYMSAYNAVLERSLSSLPIPTNKDMRSLYLTVYNLRKDVRGLKKELEKMKAATA